VKSLLPAVPVSQVISLEKQRSTKKKKRGGLKKEFVAVIYFIVMTLMLQLSC